MIALILVIALKEGTHYITAFYYNLDPGFQIANGAIGTTAEATSDIFIGRVINISGITINIGAAIISILILFVLQVYLTGKEQMIFLYDKKLHSLIEQKYRFLVGGHIGLKLFLLIFALANLLLVLFCLILYPYQGVL